MFLQKKDDYLMELPPLLFTGSSNPELANKIVDLLNIPLGKRNLHFFPDNEITVEILEPIQGRETFVVQTLFADPNIHLMELLIMIDALKRGAAKSITAILPYYGYARQDRLIRPGMSITAKLIADLLTCAGVTKVITMDLHSEQIEGFFDIPVEHLWSRSILVNYCSSLKIEDAVIVAPDKGGIKIAGAYSRDLKWPMALIDKERIDPFHVEMHLFVGDVVGKSVIITDDMCSTAGTLINAAETCTEFGAKRIIALVAHGLFVGNAFENLEKSSIEMIICTDSISVNEKIRKHPKIRIVSIASLFAEAIQRMAAATH